MADIELRSRLPGVGTTIFTIMSEAARKCGALNLSQGYPAFDPPDELRELVALSIRKGRNQYAPMAGVPELTEAIAGRTAVRDRRRVDPVNEVTVTAGATEGLFCAIQAFVGPGDEAVLLDPAYDAYAPAVTLAGARPRHVAMDYDPARSHFSVDWSKLEQSIGERTRLLVVNFPHNPTGALLDAEDLDRLAAILRDSPALLLADEVYEHIVFDGRQHRSVLTHDELWERSCVVSSFGKSLHATGWKIGYCVAPARLSAELRKVHQFTTFAVSTPMQYAIAEYLERNPDFAEQLAGFYQEKRDRFLDGLRDSRFRWSPAASTFFQLLDYSAVSAEADERLALSWTGNPGVASIPVSVFSKDAFAPRLLRFCFAKDDATLDEAARRLSAL